MAVVANLDAILGAKIDQFDRGIDGAIVSTEELQKQLKEAGITQREWNKILKEGERVTEAMRTPLEIYEQELRDLDRLLKAGLVSQETYNRAVTKAQAAVNAASPAQKRLNQQLAEGRSITASLRTPLEIYQQELVQLNELLNAGAISQETFNRAVLRGNANLAAAAAPSRLAGVAGSAKALGASFAVLGSLTALKDLADDAIALEEQLTKSTAIIGGINDQLRDDLVEGALEVSRRTKFSVDEAAEAYFFLFSAGLDARQSISALPQVAAFAQAGTFDLALATDLATDAQSALGLTVEDNVQNLENLTRVTDALISANTLANANAQEFSEALTNKTGAALRAVGKDVEEGVAVLAAFADQGTKGADAGTKFSIVLRDLQTKAIFFKEEFADANIRVFDDGELRNIADIISDIENSLAELDDETRKTRLLELGFSDKSVSAIQDLLGTSELIREYEAAIRSAGGVTLDVAENQFTPLSRAANDLEAAIDELTAKNELFLTVLAGVTRNVAVLVDNFNTLSDLANSFEIPGLKGLESSTETLGRLFNATSEVFDLSNLGDALGRVRDVALGEAEVTTFLETPFANALLDDLGEDAEKAALKIESAVDKTNKALDELNETPESESGSNDIDSELEKLLQRGLQIERSLRTPFEIFEDQVQDLNSLLDVGAIKADTFDRAIAREREQLEAATQVAQEASLSLSSSVSDSIERNSRRAFEIIFGSEKQPEIDELKKGNELQANAIDAINQVSKAVRDGNQNQRPVEVIDW